VQWCQHAFSPWFNFYFGHGIAQRNCHHTILECHIPWFIFFIFAPNKYRHTIPEAISLLISHWFPPNGHHLLMHHNPWQCTTSSPGIDFFALLVDCFIKIPANMMMLQVTMLPHILDARYMAAKGTMPLTLIYFLFLPMQKMASSPHIDFFGPTVSWQMPPFYMPPQFQMRHMWGTRCNPHNANMPFHIDLFYIFGKSPQTALFGDAQKHCSHTALGKTIPPPHLVLIFCSAGWFFWRIPYTPQPQPQQCFQTPPCTAPCHHTFQMQGMWQCNAQCHTTPTHSQFQDAALATMLHTPTGCGRR